MIVRNHRLWRIAVIRRDVRCIICGSIKDREAHHLEDASHNPDLSLSVSNGVVLCRKHHTMFHTDYKLNFQEKCTSKEFDNFCIMYEKVRQEAKDDIITSIKAI